MRHSAQRRRIRTVMHELMFKAARMIKDAGRWILGLSHITAKSTGVGFAGDVGG